MIVSTGTTMPPTPGRYYCALSDKMLSKALLPLREYLLAEAVKGLLGSRTYSEVQPEVSYSPRSSNLCSFSIRLP
jgi:hypothetical protein